MEVEELERLFLVVKTFASMTTVKDATAEKITHGNNIPGQNAHFNCWPHDQGDNRKIIL